MKNVKVKNALSINRIRCLMGCITCTLICVFVFLGVLIKLLDPVNEIVKETGTQSFRMFTVLSNMLMGVASAMCIPFIVDGMRYRNYHLPRWVVDFLFTGVTGVALTFIIALTVLSSQTSLHRMMIHGTNLYLHTLCPVLSILLFMFINTDHNVKLRSTFWAVLPVVLYSIVYFVMAFGIGEEAGGWRDHYHFAEMMPIWLLAPLMYLFTFGIATALRLVHNAIHRRVKTGIEQYYRQSDEFNYPTIEEAVRALAVSERAWDKGGDVAIPRRIIAMMERKYQSGLPMHILGGIYLEEYLKNGSEGEQ